MRPRNRRSETTLLCGSLLVLLGMTPIKAAPAAGSNDRPSTERPNIVVMVADDLGWNDVGYHNPEIRTPHLDRLAASGVRLDQHYVQPQCTPTRVALMTGRYPSRFGMHCTAASNAQAFPFGTLTMASMLKARGYATGLFGKWHMGSKPEWGPNHYGFDYSYGSLAGAVGMYDHRYRLNTPYSKTWHRNHEYIEQPGHATDLVVDEAVSWLDKHKHQPFFLYVPFHAAHTPIVEGDLQWHEMNNHIKNPSRRHFAAAVSHLDAAVGRIVEVLKVNGLSERTMVLFFSDNGGIDTPYRGNNYPPPDPDLEAGFSSNAPLRGGKTTVYEGGMRVPALVSWPGRLDARVVSAPMHAVDWMPTIARLVRAQPEAEHGWDGQDIWSQLTSDAPSTNTRRIYWMWGGGRRVALREGDWKALRPGKDAPWELYNLARDPDESNDVAAAHPDRLKALVARYEAERAKDADQNVSGQ